MRTSLPCHQRGIALLEVLAAMLITAFGLTAISLLLVATMQYGKMAQFQTIAQQLAASYAEQMRANPQGYSAGGYDKTSAYTANALTTSISACVNPSQCTGTEIANNDQAQWRNKLRANLPGGDAYVQHSGNAVDIWVMWLEPGMQTGLDSLALGGAACPATAVGSLSTYDPQPRCYFLRVWL